MKMLLLLALLLTLDACQNPSPTSDYAIQATGSRGKPSSLLKECLLLAHSCPAPMAASWVRTWRTQTFGF